MTRYEAIEKALRQWAELEDCGCVTAECEGTCLPALSRAALALPEESKTVNSGLYNAMRDMADAYAFRVIQDIWPVGAALNASKISASNYLELREASGDPMPYKVVRDGDKVRFDVPAPPKDGE